jgi:hypothetical protein
VSAPYPIAILPRPVVRVRLDLHPIEILSNPDIVELPEQQPMATLPFPVVYPITNPHPEGEAKPKLASI